jgi:hypothetical protein
MLRFSLEVVPSYAMTYNDENSPETENKLKVVSGRKAYHTPQLIALGNDLVQAGPGHGNDGGNGGFAHTLS